MPLRLERRNSRVLLVALIALAAPTLPGCGGGGGGGGTTPPSFTASFTPSTTAAAANLIKLAEVSKSGARITLAVTVYGPTTGTDAYTYAFDLQIADPS